MFENTVQYSVVFEVDHIIPIIPAGNGRVAYRSTTLHRGAESFFNSFFAHSRGRALHIGSRLLADRNAHLVGMSAMRYTYQKH